MKISVIVSTYNQPEWLRKVLHGYLSQTFCDFELLIADDGSDDRTVAVIGKLLGICFLREAPERAIELDRRAGKRGLRGKRGRKRCLGVSVGGVSVRKSPSPRR
jgi:GT2 family glycosyltransferase